MTKTPKPFGFLDEDERAMIKSAETVFDAPDFAPATAGRKAELNAQWQAALGRSTARKPVTLRLPERDIEKLKAMARHKGMPYQTLVTSVLHLFANGDLTER